MSLDAQIGDDRESLWAAVFDSLPQQIAVLDERGTIIAVNHSWRRFVVDNEAADPGAALEGANFLATFHASMLRSAAAGADEALQAIESVMAGARPSFRIEYLCHGPTHKRWYEMHVHPLKQLRKAVVVTREDVSHRHALATERRREERYQRALLDGLPYMIWLKDTESRILAGNDQFARNAGVDRVEDLGGRSDHDFWPRELADRYREDDLSVMVSRTHKLVIEPIRAGGELRWHETYKAPVEDEDGELLGTVGFARDLTQHKDLERSLAESEARWKYALEGALHGVWDWSIDTGSVFFSARWKQLLGYREDEIGDGLNEWIDRIHPEDRDAVLDALRQHHEGLSETYASEHRLRHRDGHYLWMLDHGRALSRDENGHAVRIIGTHTDITRQKHIEHALEESLRHLKLRDDALSAISEGVLISDLQGRITHANAAFTQITGYTQKDIIGATCRILQGRATAPSAIAEIRESLRHGVRYFGEILNYRKDGTVFWNELSITPARDERGAVVQFVGIQRDITERKRLLLRLERYASEVEDLYQKAPCGYHSLDSSGLIRRINDTELLWLGCSRKDLIGIRRFAELVAPNSRAAYAQGSDTFRRTGALRDLQCTLMGAEGRLIEVLISASGPQQPNGEFVMNRVTVYDVSTLKHLEHERTRNLERLAELSRHLLSVEEDTRQRLSAELHDRASPNLAAIRINLKVIASFLEIPELPHVSERIADTIGLLEDTAASIREIGAELRPPLLDYAGLWPAVEAYAEQFSRRTSIEVGAQCAGPAVRLQPQAESLIFRILQEAMTNCAKHALATTIGIRLKYDAGYVQLDVSDNGVGFDIASLGSRTSGIGQGLLSMRDMAELAGGHFQVFSAPGSGVCIHARIPCREADSPDN